MTTRGGGGGETLIHEIGHAIGPSHPSAYDIDYDDDPTYAHSAGYAEDSREYSVMSYLDPAEPVGSLRSPYEVPLGPSTCPRRGSKDG